MRTRCLMCTKTEIEWQPSSCCAPLDSWPHLLCVCVCNMNYSLCRFLLICHSGVGAEQPPLKRDPTMPKYQRPATLAPPQPTRSIRYPCPNSLPSPAARPISSLPNSPGRPAGWTGGHSHPQNSFPILLLLFNFLLQVDKSIETHIMCPYSATWPAVRQSSHGSVFRCRYIEGHIRSFQALLGFLGAAFSDGSSLVRKTSFRSRLPKVFCTSPTACPPQPAIFPTNTTTA